MTDTMIERIGVLQTKISRCMDDVGRLSDATTYKDKQAYWAAFYQARKLRCDLEELLKLHYGEE